MGLIKLTDALTKRKSYGFSIPPVVKVPYHGNTVAVSNVGNEASTPIVFLNGAVTFENCWTTAVDSVDLMDLAILPAPPVSDKIPKGLSYGSTAQESKKEGNTVSLSDNLKMNAAPLIRRKGREGPVRRFKVLQQFEGKVTEVYDDQTFRADLIDLTDKDREEESAEFFLDDIHPSDRDLVAPGAVFYWIMGFETTPSDYKRVSEIRMRRSPRWSEHEIDSIKREGNDLFDRFTRGKNNASATK